MQGLFSAVWGLSSVAGPIIGGYLTDHVGWRWVFLVSVPFAIVGDRDAGLVRDRAAGRAQGRADRLGRCRAALTAGLSSLLLGRPGRLAARDRDRPSALLAASVAFLVLFVFREHRAADPILPMDLMMRPMIAASLAGELPDRRDPVRARHVRPAVHPGRAGRRRTLAGRALDAALPDVGDQRGRGGAGGRASRVSLRRPGRLGASSRLGSLGLVLGAVFPQWYRVRVLSSGWCSCGLGMGPTSLSFILAVQHAVKLGPARGGDGRGHLPPHDRRCAGRRPAGCGARLGAGAPAGRGGRAAGSTSPPPCGPRPTSR